MAPPHNDGDPKNELGNSQVRNAFAEKTPGNLFPTMINVIPASDKVGPGTPYDGECEDYGRDAINYRRRLAGLGNK